MVVSVTSSGRVEGKKERPGIEEIQTGGGYCLAGFCRGSERVGLFFGFGRGRDKSGGSCSVEKKFNVGAGGSLVRDGFRVCFLYFFLMFSKCPPPFCVS